MKIAVLGAGMVGRTIATDLSKDHDVTSFDIRDANLSILQNAASVKTQQADLKNFSDYASLLAKFPLVVSAVPGFMGYRTLQTLLEIEKNVVDISFFPEDALQLADLAKQNDVTAIVDCGVAPGMSNLILGRYNEEMEVQRFECMVGGLPKVRNKPFEYKAPFSPIDVIEEYTRPARYQENGHLVTRPALSDAVLENFEGIGTLESFNTDGLRSILFTMPHIPNMKEKTLRYPGHIALIQALQLAGFFADESMDFNGHSIRPVDFTSRILFNQWKLQPGDQEFTVMKIIMEGLAEGKPQTVEYFLHDEYDEATNTSSMSRTTAYTCTAAVNLFAKGLFREKGVFPPELVGKHKACFNFVMAYLAARNVIYKKTVS
ncbi:MAG: saccharopine dehydrogenase [Chitinophagaceae bacterium]|nr:MAG: saccharopine dehydrogenase [Chitinophagaceae bacterium]